MERPLILDRYRPLEEIGEGGFGSVLLAWDTRIQRRVAIKRIPLPHDGRGRAHIPPGLSEARTAAMLSHPNIVQVFDFDTDADEAFLIMEHVAGASLRSIIDSEGRLSLDEAGAVVEAISEAVDYAHENGVLHLDIKPENILVDARGRVKIVDFGLADLSSAMGYSRANSGTLGYMPPEQLESAVVDERTDLWALASVTLEILAGENLYAAQSASKSLSKIRSPYLTPASTLRSDLPGAADAVFAEALAADPDDRPTTMAQFAADLLPLLGDPRAGRESLSIIVEELIGDETGQEIYPPTLGLWDRIDGRVYELGRRASAAVGAGFLGWLGVSAAIPANNAIAGGVSALIALSAVLAPRLGSALGALALCAGLVALKAYLAGVALVILAALWWWFAGRTCDEHSSSALQGPVLSLVWLAPMQPLLAGFTSSWRSASIAAAASGLLTAIVTNATGGVPLLSSKLSMSAQGAAAASQALLRPSTYVIILAWVVAALMMSLLCSRASRVLAGVGAVVSSAIVLTGVYFAERLVADAAIAPGLPVNVTVAILVSLILMLAASFLGSPLRAEESE